MSATSAQPRSGSIGTHRAQDLDEENIRVDGAGSQEPTVHVADEDENR